MGKKHRQWADDDDGEGCYGQILMFKDVPTNDTEHDILGGVGGGKVGDLYRINHFIVQDRAISYGC